MTRVQIKNFEKVSNDLNFSYKNAMIISEAKKKKNGTIKIIGGNVRDLLKNQKMSSDTDLVTDLDIKDLIYCFKEHNIKFIKTGFKFGSITIILNKELIEITSLREEKYHDGRWTKTFHTNDWKLDAARRDFTINSIYCDLKGEIFDPFNGIKDLKNQKVKFIGNPELRILEDNLRILRFLRFSLRFSKEFDRLGFEACKKLKANIRKLSFERKNQELLKMICLKKFETKINKIISAQILEEIFESKINFKNIKKLFYAERTFNLVDAERRIKFFLNRSMNTLIKKYPNKFKKSFFKRIKSKIKISSYEQKNIRKILFKFSKNQVIDQLITDFIDCKINKQELKYSLKIVENYKPQKKPFSGKDLIKLGIKNGVIIGQYLDKLETWWVNNDFKATKDECIKFIRKNFLPRG